LAEQFCHVFGQINLQRCISSKRNTTPYFRLGSTVSSAAGSRANPRQPNCFLVPKATLMNCRKKCHYVCSRPSSLLGIIYCYSYHCTGIIIWSRQTISACDDSANTYVSYSAVPHLCRNQMYTQTSSQRNDLDSKYNIRNNMVHIKFSIAVNIYSYRLRRACHLALETERLYIV